ncbi:hypothetical protein VULLAG_LOCUS17663 [Vulpes lagopus]
MWNCLS